MRFAHSGSGTNISSRSIAAWRHWTRSSSDWWKFVVIGFVFIIRRWRNDTSSSVALRLWTLFTADRRTRKPPKGCRQVDRVAQIRRRASDALMQLPQFSPQFLARILDIGSEGSRKCLLLLSMRYLFCFELGRVWTLKWKRQSKKADEKGRRRKCEMRSFNSLSQATNPRCAKP
jgi:hypothetical protein